VGEFVVCGILGFSGQVYGDRLGVFKRALDTIKHRGPDGQLVWQGQNILLGHRRLAIIDLADRALQPMIDSESGLVIVFNGEIYNYIELKEQLLAKGHRFRTTSDTEVLLKGYIEWGPDILNRCNGMWAFAIWDPHKKEIFMSRDRFGKKPFYYAMHQDGLMFASEPKALHAIAPNLKEPNVSTILNFIKESNLHAGERSFYQNIKMLPSAHYAIFDTRSYRLTIKRYWDYPAESDEPPSKHYHDEFEELFEDAVRLRLRSDVDVGLTLSGGLDSSAVLAAFSKIQNRKMKCYTSVFSETERSEEHWAQIAAKLGHTEVESVAAPLSDWFSTLNKAIHHLDSPGIAPAIIPLWGIMAKARQDNTPVILEGQGADELLAGYAPYFAIQTLGFLKRGNLLKFAQSYGQMQRSFTLKWSSAWLARKALPRLAKIHRDKGRNSIINSHLHDEIEEASEGVTPSATGQTYDPLHQALWLDHSRDVLPNLLHYGDSISMAHGIESRLPFMDYRLVEWVFRSRPPLLESKTKTLVREYLHRQNFDLIANRKDKLGFPTPMLQWFRTYGSTHFDQILDDPSADVWTIADRKGVKRLADMAKNGGVLSIFHLYKVVTLDLWLRQLKAR
jgi:asparagine synthase (glutamine-hydrolysing)